MTSSSPSRGVKFDELVRVLSKIEHLEMTPTSTHSFLAPVPHLCWRLKSTGFQPFARIPYLLSQFEGENDWYLVDDFPQVCVFPQPKGQFDKPSDEPLDFLISVQADIPQLAAFLEEQLGSHDRSSFGFTVLEADPEAAADDYFDPESAIHFILARDPVLLKEQWAPTSEWDRALHYGLTAGEIGALKRDVDRLQTDTAPSKDAFHILAQLTNPHSTVAIGNEDLPMLDEECILLSHRSASPETLAGLKKLRAASISAQKHELGILVKGS
jgi:hypothetical protein